MNWNRAHQMGCKADDLCIRSLGQTDWNDWCVVWTDPETGRERALFVGDIFEATQFRGRIRQKEATCN